MDIKKAAMDLVRQEIIHIPPNWTHEEVEFETCRLLQLEPLKSLTAINGRGTFYTLFARRDRRERESSAFTTERGGVSKRKRNQDSKRSRPVILKQDGTIIRPIELWNSGFLVKTLHEGFNPTRSAALEKMLQQKTLHLPLGRRLHRNYCGGAKIRKDSLHMSYGVCKIHLLTNSFRVRSHLPS